MRNARQQVDAHPLALEIGDAADRVVGKKLEAADMDAGQHFDGRAAGDVANVAGWKIPVEIGQVVADPVCRVGSILGGDGFEIAHALAEFHANPLNVGDALAVQQRFGDVKRRLAVG